MTLTYKNIQDLVLQYRDLAGNTGTGLTLVKNAITIAHQKRVTQERWNFMMWPTPVQFTTKAISRNYTLNPLVQFVDPIWNSTAKQQLHETPSRARYKSGVLEDRYHFEFVMDSPVQTPFTQGLLTIAGHLQVTYVDTNNNLQIENITNANTLFPVATVVGVTHMDTLTATITDSQNFQLLALGTTDLSKAYPQIRFFDDQSDNEIIKYRFYRKPKDLVNDNDIPDIPYPFSNIIVYDALMELAQYDDDTPPQYWAKQQAEWELRLQQAYQEGEMSGAEGRIVQEVDTYQG